LELETTSPLTKHWITPAAGRQFGPFRHQGAPRFLNPGALWAITGAEWWSMVSGRSTWLGLLGCDWWPSFSGPATDFKHPAGTVLLRAFVRRDRGNLVGRLAYGHVIDFIDRTSATTSTRPSSWGSLGVGRRDLRRPGCSSTCSGRAESDACVVIGKAREFPIALGGGGTMRGPRRQGRAHLRQIIRHSRYARARAPTVLNRSPARNRQVVGLARWLCGSRRPIPEDESALRPTRHADAVIL